jgi:exodeoxyribonuclease VII small subunit
MPCNGLTALRAFGYGPPMTKSSRSGAPAGKPVEALSFEKALAELERLVAQMEGGNLSLEQALAAHKRGLELARFCQSRLAAAEQQVKVLEGEVLKPLSALTPDDRDDA